MVYRCKKLSFYHMLLLEYILTHTYAYMYVPMSAYMYIDVCYTSTTFILTIMSVQAATYTQANIDVLIYKYAYIVYLLQEFGSKMAFCDRQKINRINAAKHVANYSFFMPLLWPAL